MRHRLPTWSSLTIAFGATGWPRFCVIASIASERDDADSEQGHSPAYVHQLGDPDPRKKNAHPIVELTISLVSGSIRDERMTTGSSRRTRSTAWSKRACWASPRVAGAFDRQQPAGVDSRRGVHARARAVRHVEPPVQRRHSPIVRRRGLTTRAVGRTSRRASCGSQHHLQYRTHRIVRFARSASRVRRVRSILGISRSPRSVPSTMLKPLNDCGAPWRS